MEKRSSKKPCRKRQNMAVSSVCRCRTAGVLFEQFESSLLCKHGKIGQRGPMVFYGWYPFAFFESAFHLFPRADLEIQSCMIRFGRSSSRQSWSTEKRYGTEVSWVNLITWSSWSLDLVAHHFMSTQSVIHRSSGNNPRITLGAHWQPDRLFLASCTPILSSVRPVTRLFGTTGHWMAVGGQEWSRPNTAAHYCYHNCWDKNG